MRYIALDCETTGFDPYRDRIVELALVEVTTDLVVVGEWTGRFNPGISIPSAAVAHHGIRDEDIAGMPYFHERAARIQRIVAGATLIAYNGTKFDVPLLQAELRRAGQLGVLSGVRVIDPLITFRKQYPHNLATAVRHYTGHEHIGWHSARRDVDGLLSVLRAQCAMGVLLEGA